MLVSACEGERRILLSVCVYACLASTHVRVYILAGSCVCQRMFSDYACASVSLRVLVCVSMHV